MPAPIEDFKARLEAFPWGTVHHAYGTAEDVPPLLLGLLAPSDNQPVWFELYGNLQHQGTRYEATLAAVPFLVEMLDLLPAVTDRMKMVFYLVDAALGEPNWHLNRGYQLALAQGAYINMDLARRLYEAVQDQLGPKMLSWASENPNPKERAAALWSLAWFPALRETSVPILDAAANGETGLISQIAYFALDMLDLSLEPPDGEDAPDDMEDKMDEHDEMLNALLSSVEEDL